MTNWGGEFSFFQGIYVRIDIGIEFGIELTQMSLIK